MSEQSSTRPSRRDLIRLTAASALAGVALPAVHAAGDDTIRLALVGCGGRGTGAAANALSTTSGPIKLVAMADVFEDRLRASHRNLSESFSAQVDVPDDRRFIGFDAYQKAMDCLRPGDVVALTTPPAFRWPHFRHAVDKGLNVFMEKPVTVDGPTSRRMFQLGELSVQKGLKVGVGLMCRHCTAREALYEQIKKGKIGEILLLRAYRLGGRAGLAGPDRGKLSELLYQVKKFHAFLWASGGIYSDYLIHNIDECCWMKDAWPVQAQATGGRQYRGDSVDQNFDHYAVEYTFADGAKLLLQGRTMFGCHNEFASYAHGTRGSAVISTSAHTPARCRIYKGQEIGKKADLTWSFGKEPNPYQTEWDRLIQDIRKGRPHNEVKRGVEASLVTVMGRLAAHTGRVVSYQEALAHEQEFAPGVDRLTMASAAPLPAGRDGKYPVPQPGVIRGEY